MKSTLPKVTATILAALFLCTNAFGTDDLKVVDPATNLPRTQGDVPVTADFDGDGVKDTAVWRPSNSTWYILRSSDGYISCIQWGPTTPHKNGAIEDIPVPADYTGDGQADLAVFRAGIWFVKDLTTNEIEQFEFGFPDSQPVPADYDGDGTADYAVYRRGTYYIYDSGKPRFRTITLGSEGDVPLASLGVKPSLVAAR